MRKGDKRTDKGRREKKGKMVGVRQVKERGAVGIRGRKGRRANNGGEARKLVRRRTRSHAGKGSREERGQVNVGK